MTTRTPKWAVGMRKMSPGIYLDHAGTQHICTSEVCEHLGVEPTEENQEIVERMVRKAMREVPARGFEVEHRQEGSDV